MYHPVPLLLVTTVVPHPATLLVVVALEDFVVKAADGAATDSEGGLLWAPAVHPGGFGFT